MKKANVLVFGASITWGAYDLELGGWVERLKIFFNNEWLKNNADINVYNLGISREATEDLLKRIDAEIAPRVSAEKTIILFSIGINDSQFINSTNDWRISEDEFKENLIKLMDIAQAYKAQIIFAELTGVDDSKTNPIPWNPKKSYKNERIKKFNTIIKSICDENKLGFIDLQNIILKENLIDGLHPNSEGHRKIFEIVKDYLINNKIV